MSDSSPHTLSHQAGSAAARLSFTAGVCVFVGCNWPLLWPPTPHVFLIATTDLSVVKLKRCCSVWSQDVAPPTLRPSFVSVCTSKPEGVPLGRVGAPLFFFLSRLRAFKKKSLS